MKCQQQPRIVLVPYPAQGHVTPMLQLAAAMRGRGFRSVIVTPSFIHERIAKKAKRLVEVVFVPISDGLGEDEHRDFFTIDFAMENNMPIHLEAVLRSFEGDGGVACVIIDLLASWAIDVAGRCGIPVAGFWPAMLATYNLISAIPDMISAGVVSENGNTDTTPLNCITFGWKK